jgi:hypothetical protein
VHACGCYMRAAFVGLNQARACWHSTATAAVPAEAVVRCATPRRDIRPCAEGWCRVLGQMPDRRAVAALSAGLLAALALAAVVVSHTGLAATELAQTAAKTGAALPVSLLRTCRGAGDGSGGGSCCNAMVPGACGVLNCSLRCCAAQSSRECLLGNAQLSDFCGDGGGWL